MNEKILTFIISKWKIIVVLIIIIWVISAFIFFLFKTNYLKKKKIESMLKDSTVIIYNDEINKPPI